jgi:ATP-dependent DNA ligase
VDTGECGALGKRKPMSGLAQGGSRSAVTAFDPLGLLDFHALHFRTAADDDIAVWAFDLLFHDGRDVRELPLVERKELLMVLIMGTGDSQLHVDSRVFQFR